MHEAQKKGNWVGKQWPFHLLLVVAEKWDRAESVPHLWQCQGTGRSDKAFVISSLLHFIPFQLSSDQAVSGSWWLYGECCLHLCVYLKAVKAQNKSCALVGMVSHTQEILCCFISGLCISPWVTNRECQHQQICFSNQFSIYSDSSPCNMILTLSWSLFCLLLQPYMQSVTFLSEEQDNITSKTEDSQKKLNFPPCLGPGSWLHYPNPSCLSKAGIR